MTSSEEAYNKLALYTLSLGDPFFIHQYIVDAYAAQYADKNTKPITITFALVGLYLAIEKKYTGRQVQLAHMHLAKKKEEWPSFITPLDRGKMTVEDVLRAKEGIERDEAIKAWCMSVWDSWKNSHAKVASLAEAKLKIEAISK